MHFMDPSMDLIHQVDMNIQSGPASAFTDNFKAHRSQSLLR